MIRSFRRITIGLILCVCSAAGCAGQEPVEINVNAESAIIVEAKSGEVLFEKNADRKIPPASTVKVMTAIIAIEQLPLSEEISPTRKAVFSESTTAGLRSGVKYKLKDLISALLIKSANDAAVAIAEGVSGSEKDFTRLMNEKAGRMGMKNTYFATASGLPTGKRDRQYATARDLAEMMRYVVRHHKLLLSEMSRKEAVIYGSDGRGINLVTHNKALLIDSDVPWGKTGYTRQARRAFVGTNPSFRPRIVFAALRSRNLWDDITELNDKGMELYRRKHKTVFTDIIDWIRSQRERGRGHLHP